jgi:hypothetical protein
MRSRIHPGIPSVPQPPGVSPRRPATVGPNQSATPPPRPALGGARSKENSGAISECYSHAGEPVTQRYPGIAAHLQACGPCGEDFEGLLAAIRDEA